MSTPLAWDPLRRVGGWPRSAHRRRRGAVGCAPVGVQHGTQPGSPLRLRQIATYGELAERAAKLTPPPLNTVKLKDPKEYRIIGKSRPVSDNRAIVTGKQVFGIDVQMPGCCMR